MLLAGVAAFAQGSGAEVAIDNPYKAILLEKSFAPNIGSILRGVIGMVVIVFVTWCISSNKKGINWGTVIKALGLQLLIAVSVLLFPAVQSVFELCGRAFVAVLDWTKAGSNFLFGSFMDASRFGFVFVFQILPTIVFFSALTSLFFYLGILQRVVMAMGWILTKAVKLSGAESLACMGNVFVGMTEAPLMVKGYIPKMTKSELVLMMTCGLATMSGGVMAAYIGMLGGGDATLEVEFAKHLLSASVMAAPGAIALSKILVPQTEEIDNKVVISKEKIGKNILDAISNGTAEGLRLAANIAAMLLVFYALIAGVNAVLGWISFPAVDRLIESVSGGRYTDLSLEVVLAFVFYPVIWLIGVPAEDIGLVGRLLGEKLILTEFVGYQSLADMIQTGAFASTKSIIMATYVLCGFANFASIGILIGGIGGMAPNKKDVLTRYGVRTMFVAAFVALMSAAMIGVFIG